MSRKRYPSDLTDREWAILAPHFPKPPKLGRPRKHSWRELMNAVRYVLRTGCSWRQLPHDLPPWETVYMYFAQWRANGFLARLHDALRDAARRKAGKEPRPSALILDSQTARTTEKGGPAAMILRRR